MKNEITLQMKEDGTWGMSEDPYAMIECKTEDDYHKLVEAVEKQRPKAAIETQELSNIEYICPDCECANHSKFNYCWNCGQAITHC